MTRKFHSTNLHQNLESLFAKIDLWSVNPWRRYSLFLITFLLGFWLGSALGMINGVLALMDPLGAFFTVLLLELMIRMRMLSNNLSRPVILFSIIDMLRIGIVYGLFTEALKIM